MEFQRRARRDNTAFFNEQYIKLEENNRIAKTRDLFRKIGNTKGTFHPKMGTIKDRKGRDLVDAEETKKRWKEYMQELYKDLKMYTTLLFLILIYVVCQSISII